MLAVKVIISPSDVGFAVVYCSAVNTKFGADC